eukprot:CAMPEP_0114111382 /NCGR_PEP_ID=MMETSP0043_2-20121206/1825_1 /TAXON_ID=464988 /ORGANISM="Hemiselmis andersenii, Strain CCMP644" /LENGTH=163 /DNA_ID=CAMNT_0001203413 /DNA_START=21 /DNA_END=509 /DNA_ORIENTATION=+
MSGKKPRDQIGRVGHGGFPSELPFRGVEGGGKRTKPRAPNHLARAPPKPASKKKAPSSGYNLEITTPFGHAGIGTKEAAGGAAHGGGDWMSGGSGVAVGGGAGASSALPPGSDSMAAALSWEQSEHEGLLTALQGGRKRWFHCTKCSYFNDRLYHSKMHYERI